jgi:hypothetical protein
METNKMKFLATKAYKNGVERKKYTVKEDFKPIKHKAVSLSMGQTITGFAIHFLAQANVIQ